MKTKFKIELCVITIVIVLISGWFVWNTKKEKVGNLCGGWDTFGDVVCECSGQLEKYVCPPNTMCDNGEDICYGSCGKCKCYQGPAEDGIEISCDGRDNSFK